MSKEGLIYPDGSFKDREEIDRQLQLEQRGFITTQPEFVQPPHLEHFIQRQAEVKRPTPDLKYYFPNEPIINFISDTHLGGDCDYQRVQDELNAIMGKKDSFVVLNGDIIDAFCFQPAQMEQIEQVPEQIQLAKEVIGKLTDANRLLAVIPGNHSDWARKAGVNIYDLIVDQSKVPVVYGVNYFTFNVQGTDYKTTVAHQLPGNSMYTNSHPQAREMRFGAQGADIIVAGHTHRRGVQQTTVKEHGGEAREVLLVSLGTYKFGDGYGDKKGFHRQSSREMGGYAVRLKKEKGNYEFGDILKMNRWVCC